MSYDDIAVRWQLLSPGQTILHLPVPFTDERGSIQPLLDVEVASSVIIHSHEGAIRGNHYHKEDFHYSYVVSGRLLYVWRAVGNEEATPDQVEVGPGQMFFTPPMVEHAMVMLEPTVFLAFGGRTRQQQAYEEDLIRVPLVAAG